MRAAKTVTLRQEHIRQIDLLSRLEGVSFSNQVDRIIQEYLRRPDIQERVQKAMTVLEADQQEDLS